MSEQIPNKVTKKKRLASQQKLFESLFREAVKHFFPIIFFNFSTAIFFGLKKKIY